MSNRTALLIFLLAGCGTNSTAPPADSGMDAASLDAEATPDAGDTDAGIDCSTIGCGAPVFCGEACGSPCGCCPCGGETFCSDNDLVECAGGCYRRIPCGADRCLTDLGGASCEAVTCAQLEAAYDAHTFRTMCTASDACHVLEGHCSVGLGGCYHALVGEVTQADLDEIAVHWRALGCDAGRPVCDCMPAPMSAHCEAGTCAVP